MLSKVEGKRPEIILRPACTDVDRHTPFKGAATLDQGIVIDLSRLPSAGLSHDGKTMTVSPARKWDELYAELDPLNLTVIGGRVAGVGVGGLVLGCKLLLLVYDGDVERSC